MKITAEQIAQYVGGEIEGDRDILIDAFAKIEEGQKGAISFLSNPAYEPYIYTTESSVILVNKDFVPKHHINATLIRVNNAYESVAQLMTLYQSLSAKKLGISDRAFVAESATIGKDCYIAPFVYIGDNVTIGDNCTIYPNVTIYDGCKIGNNCIIHAGATIGADGFGFAPTESGYQKIPQLGIVVIEDDVEIGANACIDRSTMGATIIHRGVKIDNLVQIAHNVELGEHSVFSSQTGIAGSAKIGSWCMFGGQSGIAGHITIGDKTFVGAQSGIAGGNVAKKGNVSLMGYPAVEHREFARQAAAMRSLPSLIKEISDLKKEIEQLKAKQ